MMSRYVRYISRNADQQERALVTINLMNGGHICVKNKLALYIVGQEFVYDTLFNI
jgi:hypothetical protein